jgi:hypothetical protein
MLIEPDQAADQKASSDKYEFRSDDVPPHPFEIMPDIEDDEGDSTREDHQAPRSFTFRIRLALVLSANRGLVDDA